MVCSVGCADGKSATEGQAYEATATAAGVDGAAAPPTVGVAPPGGAGDEADEAPDAGVAAPEPLGCLLSRPDEPVGDDADEDDGNGKAGTDACNRAHRSSFRCFAATIAAARSLYFFEQSSTRLESSSIKILSTLSVRLFTVGFQCD